MNWLEILRSACKGSSQNKVAKKLGYSSATISLVLGGHYKGDLNAVKNRVQEILMDGENYCPVLGKIGIEACNKNQKLRFSVASPQRVQLFNACKICPNREDA